MKNGGVPAARIGGALRGFEELYVGADAHIGPSFDLHKTHCGRMWASAPTVEHGQGLYNGE